MNDSNADVRNTARHRTNKIRDPDSKNTFKSKETLEILREKFRLHVHKNLGALIAEDELIRLANLPQEDKVNFADKFPMHAKQLALFEKYVFPQLKLSSQGQSSVYSENTEAPCCGYSGEQNERS
jgi:hypothetical protein